MFISLKHEQLFCSHLLSFSRCLLFQKFEMHLCCEALAKQTTKYVVFITQSLMKLLFDTQQLYKVWARIHGIYKVFTTRQKSNSSSGRAVEYLNLVIFDRSECIFCLAISSSTYFRCSIERNCFLTSYLHLQCLDILHMLMKLSLQIFQMAWSNQLVLIPMISTPLSHRLLQH